MAAELDSATIQEAARQLYAEVAHSAEGKLPYPTGRAGLELLGYEALIAGVPEEALASFCGVGNPFSLGEIRPGDVLLDVGCGCGLDLIVASRLVGPQGEVRGIDLTPAMIEKARQNLRLAGVTNGGVQLAGAEAIPYGEATFDVVISNGVLNLSPHKERCFQEIHRVLKPGGRLQFADIVVKQDLPPEVAGSLNAWSK